MAFEVHSAIPATKSALKTVINAASTVKVDYGDAGETARKERIWLGPTDIGNDEPVSMKSGRRRLQEEFVIHVMVEVISKSTPEASETRVFEIAADVEDAIASDFTLGGVENLLWALVDGKELDTSEHPDRPMSVLDIRVACTAQLGRA